MELDEVIEILKHSVKKHGEKPMTNTWLLNVLKKARNEYEKLDFDDHVPF